MCQLVEWPNAQLIMYNERKIYIDKKIQSVRSSAKRTVNVLESSQFLSLSFSATATSLHGTRYSYATLSVSRTFAIRSKKLRMHPLMLQIIVEIIRLTLFMRMIQ